MVPALAPTLEAALTVSTHVMVLGLRSRRELGLASILGASHATLRGADRPGGS
jgi:hypothetical protein